MSVLTTPRKIQLISLGSVTPQGINAPGVLTGESIIQVAVPTHRVHWSIEIGWDFADDPDLDLDGSRWSLYPVALLEGSSVRMRPVKDTQQLPDGFEGESSVRLWHAVVAWDLDGTPGHNHSLQAVVTWDAASFVMSDAERAYWLGQCHAERISRPVGLYGASD